MVFSGERFNCRGQTNRESVEILVVEFGEGEQTESHLMVSDHDRPDFGQRTDPSPPPRAPLAVARVQPDHLLDVHLQDALLTTSKL